MKNPEFLMASGVTRAAVLDFAATLGRRTGHPVGITHLATGSSLLYVLDSPELKAAEFDQVVCPDSWEQPHVVSTADACASETLTAVPA